jgi:hypothetical protein
VALLERPWRIDALRCTRCGGEMALTDVILDPAVAEKIIGHVGLTPRAPAAPRSRATTWATAAVRGILVDVEPMATTKPSAPDDALRPTGGPEPGQRPMGASAAHATVLVLVFVGWFLVANLLLKLTLSIGHLPWAFAVPFILVDWKLLLLLAGVVSLRAFPRLWRRVTAGLGPQPRRRAATLGLIATLLALLYALSGGVGTRASNAFGFYGHPPNKTKVIRTPRLPDATVVTNSYGYRGHEWRPQPEAGVRRVLVTGDSFVFGAGIPTNDGLVDRFLERNLNQGGARRWEAINIGFSGAGIYYYVRSLVRVSAVARPSVLVMCYLKAYDTEPFDPAIVLADYPRWFVGVLDRLGVLDDVQRHAFNNAAKSFRAAVISERDLRAARREMDELIRVVEANRMQLIVWEYYDPDPVFAPYRKRPDIHFMSWADVPQSESQSPLGGKQSPAQAWLDDPRYMYIGDGHPTPQANELIGRAMARKVHSLETVLPAP